MYSNFIIMMVIIRKTNIIIKFISFYFNTSKTFLADYDNRKEREERDRKQEIENIIKRIS